MRALPWFVVAGMAFAGFPLCEGLGLVDSLAFVGNGAMPTPEALLEAGLCAAARAIQCVVGPIALATGVIQAVWPAAPFRISDS